MVFLEKQCGKLLCAVINKEIGGVASLVGWGELLSVGCGFFVVVLVFNLQLSHSITKLDPQPP